MCSGVAVGDAGMARNHMRPATFKRSRLLAGNPGHPGRELPVTLPSRRWQFPSPKPDISLATIECMPPFRPSNNRFDPSLPTLKAGKWDRSSRGEGLREIAKLAGCQDGVVARREILNAGITRSVIERHVANRDLRPVYRSVYAVGHTALSPIGRWRAAILLAGKGAVLSHASAAQVHRLVDDERFSGQGMIQVTRASGGRAGVRAAMAAGQPAVRIHRSAVTEIDVCRRRGLPVTSVERTLIDLAALLKPRSLESAVIKAQRLGILDLLRLASRLDRAQPGRKGIGALRDLVDGAVPAKAKVLSDPEAWMFDLITRCGLPPPEVNERVEGIKVDFLWRKQKLIVEFDGHRFHSSRQAMRRDKGRDRRLQLAGYQVLRYTYEDLTHTPDFVAAEIAAALQHNPERS